MRLKTLFVSLFGSACAASADPVPTPSDGPVLHGSRPAEVLPLPSFAVVDHLGQARGPQDLAGRPHVLWFFPMAGTPG